MGVFDVPAGRLIEEVAKSLKENNYPKPEWTEFVKTGMNRERAPDSPDWWYYRSASVLYRIFKEGNLGTGRLRTYYGGRKNRGVKPEHVYKASGKIIRSTLQELEKQGFVKKAKVGRVIAPKGQKLLNDNAKAIAGIWKKEIEDKRLAGLVEKKRQPRAGSAMREELRKAGAEKKPAEKEKFKKKKKEKRDDDSS
ncbi:MAG: 30S ribosomal protein S19e [Candidatus Diapherotrites archaeon]|nr:30S ribosomal protein S19e [Candidatus Diapherotrites archaeon]